MINNLIITHESILTLIYGVPIGIFSGIYSGVIVSRYTRFAELRNEVLRIVRGIDFIQQNSYVAINNDVDISKLPLISSDFIFLKHIRAAELVNILNAEVLDINYKAKHGQISFDDYAIAHSNWQSIARELPANKLVLWSLWARL